MGADPTAGKVKCAYCDGKTRQEAANQLAQALSDLGHGTFVAPHKLTVGKWLDVWRRDYKKPNVRPLTYDGYEMAVRYHQHVGVGCCQKGW